MRELDVAPVQWYLDESTSEQPVTSSPTRSTYGHKEGDLIPEVEFWYHSTCIWLSFVGGCEFPVCDSEGNSRGEPDGNPLVLVGGSDV